MTPAEALLESGKLLANPSRWCQGALARTGTGMPVAPTSTRARRWDSVGVIYRVARCKIDDLDSTKLNAVGPALAAASFAAGRLYKMGIVAVNDELGHEAVMACFRLAYRRMRDAP